MNRPSRRLAASANEMPKANAKNDREPDKACPNTGKSLQNSHLQAQLLFTKTDSDRPHAGICLTCEPSASLNFRDYFVGVMVLHPPDLATEGNSPNFPKRQSQFEFKPRKPSSFCKILFGAQQTGRRMAVSKPQATGRSQSLPIFFPLTANQPRHSSLQRPR